MKIIYTNTYEEMSRRAAAMIAQQVILKPSSVLGFATGSTPIRAYEILVSLYEQEIVDFSQIKTFNLDEYVGLAPDHPQSYSFFMNKHLFHKIHLTKNQIHLPSGIASDLQKECAQYEEQIQRLGGIDLQLLGIGSNGHIGFNEPGTPFGSETRTTSLSEETIQANSRFFSNPSEVPRKAITMGIKTIMNTKNILLLISGIKKTGVIHDALFGPVTEDMPASIIQLHPLTTVIIDKSIMEENHPISTEGSTNR